MKISPKVAIVLSGLIWLSVGFMLMYKGLFFIIDGATSLVFGQRAAYSLIQKLIYFTGNYEQAALIEIALAIFVGFLKSKMIFRKTVNRFVTRVRSLKAPIPFTKVYTFPYLLILAFMALLGVSMKYLPIPIDVRGFIDIAVGAALINGAMMYFRSASKSAVIPKEEKS